MGAKYNLNFDKLVDKLRLGTLKLEPKQISGGLLHRMFRVDTTNGSYAVKALNHQIMIRPHVKKSLRDSEMIAQKASKNLNAVLALKFGDDVVFEVDGQYYMVFDWVDGKSIKGDEISCYHSRVIGEILADLHMTDFRDIVIDKAKDVDVKLFDWDMFLELGLVKKSPWIDVYIENIELLKRCNQKILDAHKYLSRDMTPSHRDMDPKNVMWVDGNPFVIDWEAASFINPMHELISRAYDWSEKTDGSLDEERFIELLRGYEGKTGKLDADWIQVINNGFSGMLGWLEYSLKRSLAIECTDYEEKKLGTEEVFSTIQLIINYENKIEDMLEWIAQV